MSEPFIAEICIWANLFAPRGWAYCEGQQLPLAQNTALFAVIGTFYGGNARTTMQLPDLRGRTPMHWGRGPGLSTHRIGDRPGTPLVTLTGSEMPSHTHLVCGQEVNATANAPTEGDYLAMDGRTGSKVAFTHTASGNPTLAMSPHSLSAEGQSEAHDNIQPYLAIPFCIALVGIFPMRP